MSTSHLTSPRDYLRMIFRRKWALLVPLLCGVVIAPVAWPFVRTKYRATALVRRKDLAAIASTPSSLMSRGGSHVPYKTLRIEILTPTNLERVIRQLKFDVDLPPADWIAKYEELRSSISINRVAQSRGVDLINISALSGAPERAQNIANALADNYVEQSKRIGREDIGDAMKFHEAQAKEYKEKLRKAEEELDKFRRERIADLPDVKQAILQGLLALRMEDDTRSLQVADAKSRLSEIEKQMTDVPNKTVKINVASVENPEYTRLKDTLEQYQQGLKAMLTRLKEAHPRVVRVRKEIALLKEQLEETPARLEQGEQEIINPVYARLLADRLTRQQEIKGHQAAIEEIGARIKTNEKKIRDMVSDEKRYSDLMRDFNEYSEIYLQYRRSLIASRTRLEAEAGQYGTQVELVQRALLGTPHQAGKMKLAMACLAAGLGSGVALMLGLEFCDRSFRNVEDVRAFFRGAEDAKFLKDLPILASIPTIVSVESVEARARRRRWIAAGLGVAAALLLTAALAVYGVHLYRPTLVQGLIKRIISIVGSLT